MRKKFSEMKLGTIYRPNMNKMANRVRIVVNMGKGALSGWMEVGHWTAYTDVHDYDEEFEVVSEPDR